MNITDQEWTKFCEMYELIVRRATNYLEESVPQAYFERFEPEDDGIAIYYEVSYCGCCPNETERIWIDFETTFDDDFNEKLEERRQERIARERDAAIAEARQIDAERKAARKKQYEELRKEFG
jgi:hypothetical protein